MTSASYNYEVANTFEALPAATENLSLWLEAQSVDPAASYLAALALEELVTNCIKYGYDDKEKHVIKVGVDLTESEMVMSVEDDGHPFNPLAQAEPDTTLPVEERPIGGLGIHLLRKMSDKMGYLRENGVNRVTLHKSRNR
jgi:anti-sigma regulatory factor (Ser/Thr protein kinase)